MTTRNANVTVRDDLTTYAHGITQDMKRLRDFIDFLAPTVVTGSTTGNFNMFDDQQDFDAYAKTVARRAIGGKAATIEFLSTEATYDAKPYGLNIPLDKHEKDRVGNKPDAIKRLEKAKTRTLLMRCMLSYAVDVVTMVKASVAAQAGLGNWSDPNVNPLDEIEALLKGVFDDTGIVPNCLSIDYGAWLKLKHNPAVLKRLGGAEVAVLTKDRLASLLDAEEMRVEIVRSAMLSGGNTGNTAAKKKGILAGSVLAFSSSGPMATEYDPSFAKSFTPYSELFNEVYSFEDGPNVTMIESDWTAEPKIIASTLCRRLDVQGA